MQESNDGTARIARLKFACGERIKIDSQGYLKEKLYRTMWIICFNWFLFKTDYVTDRGTNSVLCLVQ